MKAAYEKRKEEGNFEQTGLGSEISLICVYFFFSLRRRKRKEARKERGKRGRNEEWKKTKE